MDAVHDPAIPVAMIVWSLEALEHYANHYGTTHNTTSASEHAGLAWWWLAIGEDAGFCSIGAGCWSITLDGFDRWV